MTKLVEHIAPVVRRLLPLMPERSSRFILAVFLRLWPGLWGLDPSCERVRCAKYSFAMAYPDRDPADQVTQWTRCRARDLATSMVYMARNSAGRRSRLVETAAPSAPHDRSRARVIAFLHYAIDPALQLALIARDPHRRYKWPTFPIQDDETPAWREERELWLAGGEVPEQISRMMLSVTSASWLLEALQHVRHGGDVFAAIDVGFDAKRPASHQLDIGEATMPMAPAVELLSDIPGADLVFAYPTSTGRDRWKIELERMEGPADLARRASEWIVRNPHHWSGWPYLTCRQDPMEMRRIVSGLS